MVEVSTATQFTDLIDSVCASWPRIAELLADLEDEQPLETRLGRFRHIGAIWYAHGNAPELLAEMGFELARRLKLPFGLVVSELLLAFGEAQEEQRAWEWETHLINRVAELDGLHRIICAANSTLDLDASLQTVVETVAQVIGVDVCSIYLYDRQRDELVLRATRGVDQAGVGQVVTRLGQGVTGAAAQAGKPVVVCDVLQDNRYQAEPYLAQIPMRSMLAVPIVLFSAERFQFTSGKLHGVINIQTKEPRTFTQEEINFVEVAAGELAFFVANAQLYQQVDDRLHQKVRELTSLQQVSKRITEQLGLTEVLDLIAEKAVELSGADRADIFQIYEEGNVHLAASHGGSSGKGIIHFVAQAVHDGRPLAVINAFEDARFPKLAEVAKAEGFLSFFCMPLQARGHTIGGICLYTNQTHHFDYDQVRLLSTFADEAASAIENARLYDESLRALAVKSALLQEMHHRVRNNLQTISALLAMQLRRLEPESAGAQALRESVSRIQSIAAVHNLLCRGDVGITTVGALMRQVIESASTGMLSADRPISFTFSGDDVQIGSHDATILALVINELVSNAITHGLAAEGGCVQIGTTEENDWVTIEVRDDGPTRPKPNEAAQVSGLGLQIIETLVHDDLRGTFKLLRSNSDGWTRAQVSFPRFVPSEESQQEGA